MSQPYCGPALPPEALWIAWNADPVLLAGLGVLGLALWRWGRGQARWVAMAALILAFVSPLCALTVALLSGRALHHLVLAGVAAPALALALPMAARLPAWIAAAGMTAAMVAWHLPAVYAAIWFSDGLYWLMQAALLLPAWAFWSTVLAPGADARHLLGNAFLAIGLAGIMGLLGAVLTFAPGLLYLQHVDGAALWGLSALDDQQLAGLILWVPGFLPMAGLAFVLLRRGWHNGLAA
ncbi:cytochrome c oxidase assembly protein [Paracoccus subflavus]|uniref:Cytochrome c oxidase assembly protein n=1 Tax=Paracoccus subflavus TaxID=2528244 RepID=A0A4Q9G4X8_9RHOB|nr:cytochrome c oxidase assembly protein [Paracoccus subflavus]TBN39093.1 cytochrome c oxidase assembly protein [Paracoccus subflavus]